MATSAKKTSATKSGKGGSSASKKAGSLRAASSARGKVGSAKGAKINVKTATKKTAPKAAAKPAPKAAASKAAPSKASVSKGAVSKGAVSKGAVSKGAVKPAASKPSPPKPVAPKSVAAPKVVPAKAPAPVAATPAPGPTAGPTKPGKPSPPPRLTVRTPVGADELKQKIGALATATGQIRNLKRGLQKSFFEIGLILKDIDDRRLYEVKGYGSFEAFLEREIDLGKQLGLRLSRAVQVFQRDAAIQAGLERVSAAIAVFDGEVDPSAAPPAATPTSSGGFRSPIPFHKQ